MTWDTPWGRSGFKMGSECCALFEVIYNLRSASRAIRRNPATEHQGATVPKRCARQYASKTVPGTRRQVKRIAPGVNSERFFFAPIYFKSERERSWTINVIRSRISVFASDAAVSAGLSAPGRPSSVTVFRRKEGRRNGRGMTLMSRSPSATAAPGKHWKAVPGGQSGSAKSAKTG